MVEIVHDSRLQCNWNHETLIHGVDKDRDITLCPGNFYDGFYLLSYPLSCCLRKEVMGPRAGLEYAQSAMQGDSKGVCPWPVGLLLAQLGDSQVWRGRGEVLIPLIVSHRNWEWIVVSNHRLIIPCLGHHWSHVSLFYVYVSQSLLYLFIGPLIIKLAGKILERVPDFIDNIALLAERQAIFQKGLTALCIPFSEVTVTAHIASGRSVVSLGTFQEPSKGHVH